jgi:hypothetical protein
MKKILFLLVGAVFAFAACDPTHEDISNAGNITLDELIAKSSVTVDVAPSGKNGNCITCQTSAPVNAKWDIGGKEFYSNYAWKKMKKGEHKVVLTALCPDGTVLTKDYTVNCEEITNELVKYYIYGGPDNPDQKPFQPGAWDSPAMRFSSTEGAHFPTIPDDVYFGLKTLIMDVSDASADCTMMVHNGWWSATYYDNVPVVNGSNEVQITEEIAKTCAKGNGGEGKDLQFLIKSGSCTVNSVYYEE